MGRHFLAICQLTSPLFMNRLNEEELVAIFRGTKRSDQAQKSDEEIAADKLYRDPDGLIALPRPMLVPALQKAAENITLTQDDITFTREYMPLVHPQTKEPARWEAAIRWGATPSTGPRRFVEDPQGPDEKIISRYESFDPEEYLENLVDGVFVDDTHANTDKPLWNHFDDEDKELLRGVLRQIAEKHSRKTHRAKVRGRYEGGIRIILAEVMPPCTFVLEGEYDTKRISNLRQVVERAGMKGIGRHGDGTFQVTAWEE
jgi:hypothetical protein